jgi:hypothetical protein
MYERKEDMCPAVGGTAVIGTRLVSASMSTPVVEVAVAVALATVPTVASRKGEAFRIVTVGLESLVGAPATGIGAAISVPSCVSRRGAAV